MTPTLDELIGELRDKLQLYPWTATGDLRSNSLLSILDGIEKIKGVSDAIEFRWRDCEPLLEQATGLLDRALSDRKAFQSAGEKFATFTLDTKRAIDLIQIAEQEKADKKFETPFLVSSSRVASLQKSRESLEAQLDSGSNRSQAIATLTNQSGMQSNRAGWIEYLALSNSDGPPGAKFPQPLGPLQNIPRVDMVNQFAQDLDRFDREVRIFDAQADYEALKGQHDAVAASLEGAQAEQTWDDINRKHLSDRADVEKEILMVKLAMAKVDWLLDFGQQLQSIAPRYRQTVVDAYDRLKFVEAGLSNVYGRVGAQGNPLDPLPALTDEASVDSIIAWSRRSGTWLAALARRTQNYVLPISLKSKSGWASGQGPREWTFSIPEIQFDQQYFVRVRGIAGWVIGGDASALWTLDVQLPNSATFVYDNGRSASLNQGIVKCKLSAVTSRDKRQNPEVVGLASCFNSSPIGDNWVVRLNEAFGEPIGTFPDDIQLDLYLAVVQT